VQTPSDVTYRIYDWDRTDPASGQARELHIDQALQCITFDRQSYPEERRSHVASVWTTVTRLVTCEWFVLERVRMTAGLDQPIPYGDLVVWMVLQGQGRIGYGRGGQDGQIAFQPGDTLVLPAGLGPARLTTEEDCTWLEITVPKGKSGVPAG
jgi:mannose-6-phosphate isomerase